MNIREAKQEIINTVRAYLARDARGQFVIPVEKQRPLLLMGPPGIGKTAVMEQVAQACGINLVSYTITHHTRQSAIGLPYIVKRKYDDQEVSVTEYTMSEIIASICERIEISGVREGILFLDEINCVSETLSPTMLQFLQYKTFGSHCVPDGFIIVTAGNPPEYNASVRDFDVVTLDRVRRIDIEADYDAWRAYALSEDVHGAVTAYLEIHKDHFYSMKTGAEGRHFVTARGWEDLSRLTGVYESLGIAVDEKIVCQFLQDREIARSFAGYYELWNKYRGLYDVNAILDGQLPGDEAAVALRRAPFDEKLSLIALLHAGLADGFRAFVRALDTQTQLREVLAVCMEEETDTGAIAESVRTAADALEETLERQERARMKDRESARVARGVIGALRESAAHADDLRGWFAEREEARMRNAEETGGKLTAAFTFLDRVFGEGQETVLFLTRLSASDQSLRFVTEYGNDAYDRHNRQLLLADRRQELVREVLAL